MSGKLTVHCVAARNLYDAGDLIGSQDPYLKLTLGSTKLKSSVHKNGGTQAQWNDTLTFSIPADPALAPTTLHVACWDKDTISSDDLIGEGQVNLPQVLAATGAFDGWIELSRGEGGKRVAGQVHLQIQYEVGQPGGPVAAAAEGSASSTNSTAAAAAAVVGGGAVAAVLAHKLDKKKRKKKKKHGKWHASSSGGGEEGGEGDGGSASSSDGEREGGDNGGDEESGVGGVIGGIFGAIFGDD
ncbi:C2 domain-containing protein [Catenaria anguillulae PL171]|uniref:C2 domain-containing protein n=1 Tax=Catenaria anguillulae PL171 TaxID=765915 RepID=A0A1Y2HXF2_9FUNG|nr:C2 domain-containing protein [Catenaria anguillulae PL171]